MCKQCETSPVYEFTNKRKLCKICFIKYFQKKSLYAIRKFRMMKTGDIIGYYDKKDFRSIVLKEILELFSKKSHIEIVRLPNGKANKIAVSFTLDLESDEIVKEIINKSSADLKDVAPVKDNIIKPLYLFLDEEVLLYAKLRNLKFQKTKERQTRSLKNRQAVLKKDKITGFVNELEKKHPEIKRAIVNSYLKINRK